ncbi:hypothetical protein KJ652_00580 [Patescibacteria group bacterium]|nr:hypothetical protein [Patescibacteria group bacterium]MBU1123067.1 hypothetical protein [Patescibacteria group bacterium]MBU1911764.1 hypothetical protein [Patescibacteria group bacterium]
MNPQKTASQSQKGQTAGAAGSPFDQITRTEKQENERAAKEIKAMEAEKIEVAKAVADKTQKAEDELKIQANEELKEYKANECGQILYKAKQEAESASTAIEQKYKSRKDGAVERLVSQMTDSDSNIFSSAN